MYISGNEKKDESMTLIPIWLNTVRRETGLVPFVRSFGYSSECVQSPESRSESLQFCFRFSGDARMDVQEIDGRFHQARFPHFFVKRPGERMRSDSCRMLDTFYFTYAPQALDFFEKRGLRKDIVMCEMSFSPEMISLIRKIRSYSSATHAFGIADRIDMLCCRLLQETLLRIGAGNRQGSCEEEKILKIASYFQLHFCEEIDMESLVSRFGFCRRTFVRHWNACFNVTPAQYVARLKIHEAKRLLRETGDPIASITGRLCFRDPSYFGRFFRRHAGMSPHRYRRSIPGIHGMR